MSDVTVNASITFKEQDIKDLLSSAFEGGSNYWYWIEEFGNPDNIECEFKCIDLPLSDNGYLIIKDKEDDSDKPELYRLDRNIIERGIRIMSKKYPWHFENFIKDEADAETGDVFLQCCLFGDIVYG